MSGDLTFDEARHEYRLDGKILPSVTQVLGTMGFIDSTWFTDEARIRGTIVHRLCELWDKAELDPATVDPRLKGFLEAWKKYVRAEEMVWTHVEVPLAHRTLSYAGTCDRLGIDRKGQRILIDIKTGPQSDWHKWQLSAYALLVEKSFTSRIQRIGVHLKEDGQFRVETYTNDQDYSDWLAILKVFNLLEKA